MKLEFENEKEELEFIKQQKTQIEKVIQESKLKLEEVIKRINEIESKEEKKEKKDYHSFRTKEGREVGVEKEPLFLFELLYEKNNSDLEWFSSLFKIKSNLKDTKKEFSYYQAVFLELENKGITMDEVYKAMKKEEGPYGYMFTRQAIGLFEKYENTYAKYYEQCISDGKLYPNINSNNEFKIEIEKDLAKRPDLVEKLAAECQIHFLDIMDTEKKIISSKLLISELEVMALPIQVLYKICEKIRLMRYCSIIEKYYQ